MSLGEKVWIKQPGWTSSTVEPAWSELSSGTPTPRLALASGRTFDTHRHSVNQRG